MLVIVFLFSGICAIGQNLIGYNETEIKEYMKENRKDMSLNTVTNTRFKYLKYSDQPESQTILFFLNPDMVCHGVRLICEKSVRAEKVKEFDSIYAKSDENRWIDKRDGKDYIIEVRDEDWSCIITYSIQ